MNISFVIGPRGCGKTLNKQLIAEFLGCDSIIDENEAPIGAGNHVLYLAAETPDMRRTGDPVYEFFMLRRVILSDPAYKGRWKQPEEHQDLPRAILPTIDQMYAEVFGNPLAGTAEQPLSGHECTDKAATARRLTIAGFNLGDIVQLTSGGSQMTVLSAACPSVVTCGWFDSGGYHQHDFHPPCLQSANINRPL